VDPAQVYVDDGVSGALFGASRPGLARLLAALAPRSAFGVLIMSEESRLGREQIETAYVLKRITDAGVAVWFYLDDRQRTLDSPSDKVMLSLTAFASEMERDRARVRTHDALLQRAQHGHVTGGGVFGYRNVPVLEGGRRCAHLEPDCPSHPPRGTGAARAARGRRRARPRARAGDRGRRAVDGRAGPDGGGGRRLPRAHRRPGLRAADERRGVEILAHRVRGLRRVRR
jgi:hypothetical protein